MSNVIKAKRTLSSAQFLQTSRELVKVSITRYNKCSKRMKDYMLQTFIIPVTKLYMDVFYVKKLYSKFDVNCILRVKLCEKILARLEYLSSMLDLYKVFDQASLEITDKQWDEWQNLINEDMMYISGLKKKELTNFREKHFNPLDFSDENAAAKLQKLEKQLGISMFEEDLIAELNLANDEIM